jgi:predicted AAA+ superfamily ATPase
VRRKLEQTLLDWKNNPKKLPLLIIGARQVGKTWLVEHFAKQHYHDALMLNFQIDAARLSQIFSPDLDPNRIMRDLALLYNRQIQPGKTLIVFDEVQLCQPALSALKYFAEQATDIPIIATDSLFGIAVHREERYSFPVGKVQIARLYPMDFEEYLWAKDKGLWADGIRECYLTSKPFVAHRDAVDTYREYLMVGGLPAAVTSWLEKADVARLRDAQRSLTATYTADMAIYLDDSDASLARGIWGSIPRQLAREGSKKFKLADIAKGARQHQYEAPFSWLENAGLIFRHRQVTSGTVPFEPRAGGSFYKTYLLDVGLLSAQMNIRPEVFFSPDGYRQIASGFKGALAENYVKQSLVANGIESFYWHSGNTAEVDFLVQDSLMRAIPIEVKSADNVQSKSLNVFREKYKPPLSLRLSTAEFGLENGIRSVPLYAAYCIDAECSSEV